MCSTVGICNVYRMADSVQCSDIDISLNEAQAQRLKAVAQHHLQPVPPVATGNQMSQSSSLPDGSAPEATELNAQSKNLQFPLVRLYDYLHMFCLNLQLEVLYLQATSLARSRWADQLSVEMNASRTTLWLTYWHHGFQSSSVGGKSVSIGHLMILVLSPIPHSSYSHLAAVGTEKH
jgi:hypothetical protein